MAENSKYILYLLYQSEKKVAIYARGSTNDADQ